MQYDDNQAMGNKIVDEEKIFLDKERAMVQKIEEKRLRLSQKYPLVFALMGAFGLVTTFYGFENIVNRIDWLANNPIIMLVTGVVLLAITGQLYKRLG